MKADGRSASLAPLLWRLPLAVMSLAFYKTLGFGFRLVMYLYNRTHPEVRFRWRTLSGETLRMAIALPAIMTTGPRWNTHAMVATAGPLRVAKSLEVDAACANRSAKSWSVVVCTFPGMKTVTNFGSAATPTDCAWPSIALDPGNYWLALRYYRRSGDIDLPSVRVDGQEAVPSVRISPRTNDFYEDLSRRTSLLYSAMHYYMWILLQYRPWLPERLVERQYLPLGNPDTEFFFGSLNKGEAVQVDLRPEALAGHDVYFTLYSRASFPIAWHQIAGRLDVTTASQDCSYLIRVHRASPGAAPFSRSWVSVSVCMMSNQ